MDFRLTDEHEEMKRTVRKFTKQEIIPHIGEYDAKEEYPVEIIKKCMRSG
jgi:alkylation response protein AidB-like acyl-CoA dehydrogenase